MLLVHVLAFSSPHNLAALTGLVAAAAAKKSSSSFTLIFFVLLFGVGYMFLIRPQRQRRQRQLQLGKQISVGDKVMLSSGILGRVEGFVGDHARIEIAPGTVIEVLRAAVSQRVEEGTDAAGAYPGNSPFDAHGHDDLVDESDHDPYSVPPLEADKSPDSHEDGDSNGPGGNGSGGSNR
jgi:preprotein translocase subunit YajC